MIKHWFSMVMVAVAVTTTAHGSAWATVSGFDDIAFWVGEGQNRAAMIFDWKVDGETSSFVWGYQWDGTATGADMLYAIAGTTTIRDGGGGPTIEELSGADARLSVEIARFGFGDSVFGVVFDDLVLLDRTGWAEGFWSYYVAEGSTMLPSPGDWDFSQFGAKDRMLQDGSWDGWSFAVDSISSVPDAPVAASVPQAIPAVPEPMSLWLVGMAVTGCLLRRRRLS